MPLSGREICLESASGGLLLLFAYLYVQAHLSVLCAFISGVNVCRFFKAIKLRQFCVPICHCVKCIYLQASL